MVISVRKAYADEVRKLIKFPVGNTNVHLLFNSFNATNVIKYNNALSSNDSMQTFYTKSFEL